MKKILSFLFINILLQGCSSYHAPAPIVDLSPTADANQHRTQSFFDLSKNKTHPVSSGDTLYSIAWQANLDVRKLANHNNIPPPFVIKLGQVIKLGESVDKHKAPTIINKGQKPIRTTKKSINQSVDPNKKQAYVRSQGKSVANVESVTSSLPTTVSKWQWPAKGTVVGRFTNKNNPNKGIDIAGKHHSPIIASARGKVVYTGNALKGYGNLVIIKHTENFLSAYAHNEKVLVKEQQWVKSGQQIATMGSNGSKGSALHFEIRYKGKAVDPITYLK